MMCGARCCVHSQLLARASAPTVVSIVISHRRHEGNEGSDCAYEGHEGGNVIQEGHAATEAHSETDASENVQNDEAGMHARQVHT